MEGSPPSVTFFPPMSLYFLWQVSSLVRCIFSWRGLVPYLTNCRRTRSAGNPCFPVPGGFFSFFFAFSNSQPIDFLSFCALTFVEKFVFLLQVELRRDCCAFWFFLPVRSPGRGFRCYFFSSSQNGGVVYLFSSFFFFLVFLSLDHDVFFFSS